MSIPNESPFHPLSKDTNKTELKVNELKTSYEIDWFEFEQRMRKIIQEMVEPTIRRIFDTNNRIDDNESKLNTSDKKIQQIEIKLASISKLKKSIDDCSNKIREVDSEHTYNESLIKQEINNQTIKIKEIKSQSDVRDEKIENLENSNSLLKGNIDNFNDNIIEFRNDINEKILEIEQYFNEKIMEYTDRIFKLEDNVLELYELIKEKEKTLKNVALE